jgi:hypothetical protein
LGGAHTAARTSEARGTPQFGDRCRREWHIEIEIEVNVHLGAVGLNIGVGDDVGFLRWDTGGRRLCRHDLRARLGRLGTGCDVVPRGGGHPPVSILCRLRKVGGTKGEVCVPGGGAGLRM